MFDTIELHVIRVSTSVCLPSNFGRTVCVIIQTKALHEMDMSAALCYSSWYTRVNKNPSA